MLSLEMKINYPDEKTANSVYSSIVPDDDGYIASSISGVCVYFSVKAENAGQMKSAMDDLMACVKIAEEASGLVSRSAPDLDGDSLLE